MTEIPKQKRLPRKKKKQFIKNWGRESYYLFLKGKIILVPWVIKTEVITMNGRVYPKDTLKKYMNKKVDSRYYGQLSHPGGKM